MAQKRLCKCVSSDLSDAIHLSPLVGSRRKEPFDTPEPLEQRTRGRIGDPRNATQHGDPRRRRLATPHRCRHALPPFLPKSKPMKPDGGISRILGTNDRDPEVCDRQQASANRIGVPRTVVDVRTLDEQKRKHSRVSHSADLRPEPTAAERAVEIRHGLSLDQYTAGDAVIAGRQGLDHDLGSESLETRGYTASFFEDVSDDGRARSFIHVM